MDVPLGEAASDFASLRHFALQSPRQIVPAGEAAGDDKRPTPL